MGKSPSLYSICLIILRHEFVATVGVLCSSHANKIRADLNWVGAEGGDAALVFISVSYVEERSWWPTKDPAKEEEGRLK